MDHVKKRTAIEWNFLHTYRRAHPLDPFLLGIIFY
jgi:hypothetical protein